MRAGWRGRRSTGLRRVTGWAAVAVAGMLALVACGGSSGGSNAPVKQGTSSSSASALCQTKGSGNVTVGAFNFSESQLLATIYAAALQQCGYTTSVKQLGARDVVYPALTAGQIDVVPEYAATLTTYINGKKNGPTAQSPAAGDIDTTMQALRKLLPTSLVALDPAPATDKDAFAVTETFAKQHNLTSLSDLATYSKQHPVSVGGPPECPQRPYCLQGLKSTYGIQVSKFVPLDAGGPLTIAAIKDGKVDVGEVFTSDPTVTAQGLVVLDDDKNLQLSDNIVPIVNTKVAGAALKSALNAVDQKLTEDALVQMNKAVQVQHAKPEQVAQQFLQQSGLLG